MRSLSKATWTSGEPVSFGIVAYSLMTACLRSLCGNRHRQSFRFLKIQHAYRSEIASLEPCERDRLTAGHRTHDGTAFEMADAFQILPAQQANRLTATQAVCLGIGQGQGRDVVQRGLDR